jgi:hypothetical protein
MATALLDRKYAEAEKDGYEYFALQKAGTLTDVRFWIVYAAAVHRADPSNLEKLAIAEKMMKSSPGFTTNIWTEWQTFMSRPTNTTRLEEVIWIAPLLHLTVS